MSSEIYRYLAREDSTLHSQSFSQTEVPSHIGWAGRTSKALKNAPIKTGATKLRAISGKDPAIEGAAGANWEGGAASCRQEARHLYDQANIYQWEIGAKPRAA